MEKGGSGVLLTGLFPEFQRRSLAVTAGPPGSVSLEIARSTSGGLVGRAGY